MFNTWFSFSSDQHNYETSSPTQANLMKLFIRQIDMGNIQNCKYCGVVEQNPKTTKTYST